MECEHKLNKAAKDVLIEARRLVEHGWTQYSLARDRDGEPTFATRPDAVSYCMLGAFQRACQTVMATGLYADDYEDTCVEESVPDLLEDEVACQHRGRYDDLMEYNDAKHRRQSDVVCLFSSAIARLEA